MNKSLPAMKVPEEQKDFYVSMYSIVYKLKHIHIV